MGLVQKSFSDIITFSRSSNATRIGPTGVLEYAPHNLALRSEEFDTAYWSKDQSSIVANSVAAPNGTVTADKIVEDTATNTHGIYRLSFTVTSGLTYTWSVYAKKAERNWIILSAGGGVNNSAWFNLNTGAAGTIQSGIAAATITSVGNDWYRCSVTRTVSSGSANFECYASTADNTSSYTGDGTSGIYLWGAQLSVGPYPLDYVPTTSAAVYGPRFDYDGSGVTIVEPVSRNLVTYSEQFDNAAWTKTDATVTANTTTAPDGTVTADLMYPTTTGTYRATLQSNSGVSGQVYTASFYIKSAGFQWVALMTSAGGNIGVYFDVINGAKGTEASGTGTITSVGNGWFRCTITTTASSSTIYSGVTVVDANNSITATTSGTSGVYLWGAQLEVGSTATAYMVSGATNGFRAVPVVSGSATPKGLLVEEQRTNLLTYSQDVDNAIWNPTGGTVSANFGVSPDGSTNADKLIINNGALGGYVYRLVTGLSASTVYTQSVYVKQAGFTVANLWSNLSGSYKSLRINLQTGALSQNGSEPFPASYSVVDAGNGWWRVVITETTSGTSGNVFYIDNNGGTGDGSKGLLIWGAQLEAGSFATSYIPTLASTVTRSADVASVNTLSPWFNATEGTLFAEAAPLIANTGSARAPFGLSQGTVSNSISLYINGPGSSVGGYIVNGGVDQFDASLTYSNKTALAYKANDVNMSAGGVVGTTDTSATIPTINQFQLGDQWGSNSYKLNGHLKRIAYYPRRLTNAELQALTA